MERKRICFQTDTISQTPKLVVLVDCLLASCMNNGNQPLGGAGNMTHRKSATASAMQKKTKSSVFVVTACLTRNSRTQTRLWNRAFAPPGHSKRTTSNDMTALRRRAQQQPRETRRQAGRHGKRAIRVLALLPGGRKVWGSGQRLVVEKPRCISLAGKRRRQPASPGGHVPC